MGILSSLFGKKKPKNNVTITFSENNSSDSDFETLMSFYQKRPRLEDYMDRTFDMPAYNDSYIAEEGYKLRELLLLVWWGKLKKGRQADAVPPRYFFYNYNLDAQKTTKKLLKDGLLEVTDDKMSLTEKGKDIASKYKSLWEIHSFKHIPTNLDIDYAAWDEDKYLLIYYKIQVNYLSDMNDYYKEKNDFLQTSTYPEKAKDRKEEIVTNNEDMNRNNKLINDYSQKIKILENK